MSLKYEPASEPLGPQLYALNPQPSTLNPQPSTLNPHPSTLNPQPTTLHPEPFILNVLLRRNLLRIFLAGKIRFSVSENTEKVLRIRL